MDLRSGRRRTSAWLASAAVLAISAVWLRAQLQPLTFPDPPLSPVKLQAWLTSPIPPPPPPPPPGVKGAVASVRQLSKTPVRATGAGPAGRPIPPLPSERPPHR